LVWAGPEVGYRLTFRTRRLLAFVRAADIDDEIQSELTAGLPGQRPDGEPIAVLQDIHAELRKIGSDRLLTCRTSRCRDGGI
jgi:hypothetical protein